ncbi:phosphate/phosphite/phosphonate ABC transporter substrate-binding protein [Gracilibacillus dipsosauri]|uniref:Phosphate/phosphite/phosphonate ABC transporter substrate-binding protein n=1 Tax=Gracilibacillus dipsosauri TaxID=178340 RepID=A0A317KWQ4_9BACI|nr:phosphate/phosphite/phosphonate ABC transporter substrate-binding protein [Gracilibacillus dipsosauri]PWU67912.1 phosphate/phosphite/phosphonate ABC transporter substrate-binding protein [Gracilibacillus dipsosauri]
MKKIGWLFISMIAVLIIAGCGSSDGEASGGGEGTPDKLVMGFVPSQDSDTIADTVKPLADKLAEKLGVEVEGKVMTNYTALVEAMGTNEVQIGFIPAFAYVLANEKHDVEVILKSERYGSGTYKAQYLVRSDSDIKNLEDLEGKVWAYGDPTSTSGYLFPAAQIMDEFNVENPETDFFSNSIQTGGHDNSAIAVYNEEADVATTFDDVRTELEEEYPDIMDKLSVLTYTSEIPNDTISVTSELNDEFVQKIKDTFLGFNEEEEMIKIMNDVYSWDAIIEAEDSEYDVVRDTYEKFSDSISINDL